MTKQFSIRRAGEGEQTAVKQLVRDSGINPLGIHWSRFLIAVDETGQLSGCGQVKAHNDGSLELASLAVVRPWRRQGAGAAIVKALKETHGAPLWLTCIDTLIPFYEQFEFENVETPREMPPYFRRASRLFNLYLALRRGKRRLAVMVWRGD